MLLSYWIVLFIPILMLPMVSHDFYGRVYEHELTQVGMDNAAILFGQADVSWLNSLEAGNRKLAGLDQAHHPWHFCRLHPLQAAVCSPLDRASEIAIRALHADIGRRIGIAWNIASNRAFAELRRLTVTPRVVHRSLAPPIVSDHCKVCGLPVKWRVTSLPRTQLLSTHEPPLTSTAEVSADEGRNGYDYALK